MNEDNHENNNQPNSPIQTNFDQPIQNTQPIPQNSQAIFSSPDNLGDLNNSNSKVNTSSKKSFISPRATAIILAVVLIVGLAGVLIWKFIFSEMPTLIVTQDYGEQMPVAKTMTQTKKILGEAGFECKTIDSVSIECVGVINESAAAVVFWEFDSIEELKNMYLEAQRIYNTDDMQILYPDLDWSSNYNHVISVNKMEVNTVYVEEIHIKNTFLTVMSTDEGAVKQTLNLLSY